MFKAFFGFAFGLIVSLAATAAPDRDGVWKSYEQKGRDNNGKLCAILNETYSKRLYSWIPAEYPQVYAPSGIYGPDMAYDESGPYYDFDHMVIWSLLVGSSLPEALLVDGKKIRLLNNSSESTKVFAGGWKTSSELWDNKKFVPYEIARDAKGFVTSLTIRWPKKTLRCVLERSAAESLRISPNGKVLWRAPKSLFLWYKK
jgi:hypothetical protein